MVDMDLKPDGMARVLIFLMKAYAIDNGHVSASEAEDWATEQTILAKEGRFFHSITHFVTIARKRET
jgi:hypothetical protein